MGVLFTLCRRQRKKGTHWEGGGAFAYKNVEGFELSHQNAGHFDVWGFCLPSVAANAKKHPNGWEVALLLIKTWRDSNFHIKMQSILMCGGSVYPLPPPTQKPTLMGRLCWRRQGDSNPRGVAPKRFSRPPRYDRFDMPPSINIKL